MEIKIIRFGRYHHAVSGRLLIDGQHVCDTLEQDTGSLPEGEYVMCRNKASSLPYYIYSDGKTATILAELLNQKPTARICQTEKTGKSDFT